MIKNRAKLSEYVLIDLKMGKITHQDVEQIDMYVRMYNELKCKEGDNPTLGILLCAETDRVWQQQVAFQNMDLVI